MAMGTRKSEQTPMWVATSELPVSPGHPFYARLTAILDEQGFDRFAAAECQEFYAPVMGRPGLPPGRYFRLLLVGYFEGLDSERGIAWRAADSLAVREFVGLGLDRAAPDHSTISRTRRVIVRQLSHSFAGRNEWSFGSLNCDRRAGRLDHEREIVTRRY